MSGITTTERLAFWAQAESSSQMAKFIQEIRKGPTPFAHVTYLDVTLANFENYTDFKIAN